MNFCFVIDKLLSASSQPGKNRRMSQYINLYKENNIKILYSLHKPIILDEDLKNEFEVIHHKLDTIELPSLSEVNEIVTEIIGYFKNKKPVNLNCETGIGRSSLIYTAIVMKHYGMGLNEAYNALSEHRYVNLDDGVKDLLLEFEIKHVEKQLDAAS